MPISGRLRNTTSTRCMASATYCADMIELPGSPIGWGDSGRVRAISLVALPAGADDRTAIPDAQQRAGSPPAALRTIGQTSPTRRQDARQRSTADCAPMDARLQRRVQRYGWDLASNDYDPLWQEQLAPARTGTLALRGARAGRAGARPGLRHGTGDTRRRPQRWTPRHCARHRSFRPDGRGRAATRRRTAAVEREVSAHGCGDARPARMRRSTSCCARSD